MQIGKDIERYDWYYDPELFTEVIIDRLKSEQYRNSTRICELLNKQDQRIAELEEQLKNSVRPKFKKGQEVWFVDDVRDSWDADYEVFHKKVMAISYNNYEGDHFEYAMSEDGTRDTIWYGYIDEKFVFATKEQAQSKLQELQGE